MNTVEILAVTSSEINLFPESVAEEIIQNIKTLITTIAGTVPLDRRLGINADFIDRPTIRSIMKGRIFILETIQEYEPRVEVVNIDFIPDTEKAGDGKMIAKVKVRILDEYIS